MGADFQMQWRRDFGAGWSLVMAYDASKYRAAFLGIEEGFYTTASSQVDAIHDLLTKIRSHAETSAELRLSLEPGCDLDRKFQQVLHLVKQNLSCAHCLAGEPSVWDTVIFHYAHPDRANLKVCHEPWRERCRGCSADPGTCACAPAGVSS